MALTQVQGELLESGSALENIGAGGITPSYLSTQSQYTGFKNRLINGNCLITQRGSVNIPFGGGNTYTAVDRFSMVNYWGAGQVNTAQSTTAPSGFTNSLSLTVATPAPLNGSTGYFCSLSQIIEGFNIADCYNTSVTLSFWVRSSVTGTYSVTFGNANSVGFGDGARFYVANYTISAANTWEQKTITVPLNTGTASGTWNTTNGSGLGVVWNLGAESNRKGDAALNSWQTLPVSGGYPLQSASQVNWLSTSGATFFLTGVQLEKGSTTTSFDYLDYGRQLIQCQRYYQTGSWGGAPSSSGYAGWAFIQSPQLTPVMRAAPTITYASGAVYYPGGTSYTPTTDSSTTQRFQPINTAGAGGNSYFLTWYAGAEL